MQPSNDLYGTLKTSLGTIKVRLFERDAPKTVANFVGLATGSKQWLDPRTGRQGRGPFYDGTIIHRVIPEFMIQMGDRLGNGTGDAGYAFEDEFCSNRRFDHGGILAMANSGPNTNGSQFFITEEPTPHLNNMHTIFGEVVSGMDVVKKIARVPRDQDDKPLMPVVLQRVIIQRGQPAD